MEGISVDGMKFKTHYDEADVNHRRQLMKISKAAQAAVKRIKAQGVSTQTKDVQLSGEAQPLKRELYDIDIDGNMYSPKEITYYSLCLDDHKIYSCYSVYGEGAKWAILTDRDMVASASILLMFLNGVARKPSLKKRFWSAFTSGGN